VPIKLTLDGIVNELPAAYVTAVGRTADTEIVATAVSAIIEKEADGST
jgi:hypothetical protein